MERRTFMAVMAGGMAGTPRAAGAQQVKKANLCILAADSLSSPWASRYNAFIQGLTALGYVDGRNITIHFLSAEGQYDRFPALAAECVRLKPDIIVAYTTPGALAAKQSTATIPIVVGPVSDPVGTGIVASLARPGGNVTGQTVMASGLSSKRLQLLKEAVPELSRVAVLSLLTDANATLQVQEIEQAAGSMGLRLQNRGIRTADDLPAAFGAAAKDGAQGLLTTVATFFIIHRARIVELAAKHRLPAMYPVRDFVDSGGLMSYGPETLSLYRQTPVHVDKILKGAKPADLPIEQPTKFELVINLKTTKALGLTIPPSLLGRADDVIQ
jgi:putative tryptophan/tyrosine transport system substrate-binding protein